MPRPTKGFRELLDEAEALVQGLEPVRAVELHAAGEAKFIDLRDVDELEAEGRIPGSHHVPRGNLEFRVDPASPFHDPVFDTSGPFVLYCAGGWRSTLAARALLEMGLVDVSFVRGGFAAWRDAGGVRDDSPL